MKTPFFSIIIPVFNAEPYLRQCLDSILGQGFDDYEVLCIYEECGDSSLEVAKEYEEKNSSISIYTQEIKGLSAARNLGIEKAKGKYMLFLDSDDWFRERALRILAKALNEAEPDMLAFNPIAWHEDTMDFRPYSYLKHTHERETTGIEFFNDFVKEKGFGPSAVCFYAFKRELISRNKLFFDTMVLHEDELFMPLVLYYASSLKVIINELYAYRIHPGSMTKKPGLRNLKDKVYIADQLYSFFSNKSIEKKYLNKSIYNLYLSAFANAVLLNHAKELRKITPKQSYRNMKQLAQSHKQKAVSVLAAHFWGLFDQYIHHKVQNSKEKH